MPHEVAVRFEVTADDWAALADFQLAHSQTLRGAERRTHLLAVIVVVVMTVIVALVTRSMIFAVVTVVAGMIAAFSTPRTFRRNMRKQMRSMYDETFPPGSDTSVRLESRDDGLATENARGTSVLAWSALTAVDESNDHVYVGLGGASGLVIPKSRIIEGDVIAFAVELRRRARQLRLAWAVVLSGVLVPAGAIHAQAETQSQGILWELVESARLRAEGCDAIVAAVTEALSRRQPSEIRDFRDELQSYMAEGYRWDLWAVAYVAKNGASDEGFESFRAWLILRGKEAYGRALEDPAAAVEGVAADDPLECDALLQSATDAYRRAAGSHLEASTIRHPRAPAGRSWTEQTLEQEYPALVARVRQLRPGGGIEDRP